TLVRDLQYALGNVVRLVIDDDRDAGRCSQLCLGVATDPRNEAARTAEPPELGGVETDSPGRACNQHIASLQRTVRKQRKVGGHRWHAQACAKLDRDLGRNVTAWADGRHTYSDAVPNARPRRAFQVHTRSPMRLLFIPSPTWSISPAPSPCGTMSG